LQTFRKQFIFKDKFKVPKLQAIQKALEEIVSNSVQWQPENQAGAGKKNAPGPSKSLMVIIREELVVPPHARHAHT
jgi:hypothetical protein